MLNLYGAELEHVEHIGFLKVAWDFKWLWHASKLSHLQCKNLTNLNGIRSSKDILSLENRFLEDFPGFRIEPSKPMPCRGPCLVKRVDVKIGKGMSDEHAHSIMIHECVWVVARFCPDVAPLYFQPRRSTARSRLWGVQREHMDQSKFHQTWSQ